MRILGLLFLLSGSVVLMLPTLGHLLRRTLTMTDGPMMGGALLCLGVAALLAARFSS